MNQPVRWTCDCARDSSSAMRGSASAPSISTSTAFPGRGSAPPRTNEAVVASSACSHPACTQLVAMPVAHGPVEALADSVADLDAEPLGGSRNRAGAGDRISGSLRPTGRQLLVPPRHTAMIRGTHGFGTAPSGYTRAMAARDEVTDGIDPDDGGRARASAFRGARRDRDAGRRRDPGRRPCSSGRRDSSWRCSSPRSSSPPPCDRASSASAGSAYRTASASSSTTLSCSRSSPWGSGSSCPRPPTRSRSRSALSTSSARRPASPRGSSTTSSSRSTGS